MRRNRDASIAWLIDVNPYALSFSGLFTCPLLGGGSARVAPPPRGPGTGEERVLHSFGHGSDGGGPVGLIDVHGTLYGATGGGGTFGEAPFSA